MRWNLLDHGASSNARRPGRRPGPRPSREAELLLVSMALAALLVGVAGAAQGQVALLPRTQQVPIATGDAATDELAAVAVDGGFALIWNRDAEAPQGETIHLQRLGLDAEAIGSPVLHTVNVLAAIEAVAVPDGLTFGYLTTLPFQVPSIALRRHQGEALDATGNAAFTDAGVAPFRLTPLGADAAAALYAATATVFELGTPGSAEKVPLPFDEAAGLAGMPAGGDDLFVFTPDPTGGVEPSRLVRYRVSGGAVVEGPDVVVTGVTFGQGTPLWIAPADGQHLLVWRSPSSVPFPGGHAAVFLGANGEAIGAPFSLELVGRAAADLQAVAVDGQGLIWSLWRDSAELLVAAFAPGETSATALSVVSGALPDHTLAVTPGGTALVAWIDPADRTVRGQVFEECAGGTSGAVLCLQRGRFLVELEFETADGEEGAGKPVPTRSVESGLFWFFTPDNWEFLVKVLPACPINGFYWVFAAPTTDIGFTLRVLDTQTLQQRTYVNPVGTLPTVINDTGAFACGGS